MSIRKDFVELYDFILGKNKEGALLDDKFIEEIKKLCESKKKGSCTIYNDNYDAVAIFCYYHKRWEILDDVEYGKKSKSKNGFNTMCKEGVREWTRSNNLKRTIKADVMQEFIDDKIKKEEIESLVEARKLEVDKIKNRIDELGFDNEKEVLTILKERELI